MGRLYRRHSTGPWYGDFKTPEGKRVQRSLGTTDKQVARERLRLAELEATPKARGRKQTLNDAIDHMIGTLVDKAAGTVSMYQEKARRIETTLGNPSIHDVTRDMLSEYIRRRLNKEDRVHGRASPHTVKKELITIRRALQEAVDRGILTHLPPFPRFSAQYKPRETWLTPEQFELVRAELDSDHARWASLAALAGANLSEVEGQDWRDIDFTHGRIRIRGTKRLKRDRTLQMAPALRHVLEQVPAKDRHGKVVRSWKNVRRDLHRAVDRANAKLAKDAPRIPYVSPNDLRRTFASWLVQQGVPALRVATLMGHSSTRMVETVYGRLSPENLDDAIGALPLLDSPPIDHGGVTHGVTESVLILSTPVIRGHNDGSSDED